MGTAAEALTLSALRLLQRPDLLQRGRGGASGPTWGALPVPAAGGRQTAGWTVLNDALGRKTEPAWHGDCPHTMQAP